MLCTGTLHNYLPWSNFGQLSLNVVVHLGRPKAATTDDNIAQVHEMVLDDGLIKVREIEEASGESRKKSRGWRLSRNKS